MTDHHAAGNKPAELTTAELEAPTLRTTRSSPEERRGVAVHAEEKRRQRHGNHLGDDGKNFSCLSTRGGVLFGAFVYLGRKLPDPEVFAGRTMF